MQGPAPGLCVPAHEAGVIRIFAPAPADPALAAILPPHPLDAGHLAPLLGVDHLRTEDAERIPIRDLGDYTLSEFLRIGHDIRSAELAPCAARLDGLSGHVILVHSSAFEGRPATLRPAPSLAFLGAFRRNDAPPTPLSLPEAPRPEILTPPASPDARLRRRSGLALLILTLVLGAVLLQRLLD